MSGHLVPGRSPPRIPGCESWEEALVSLREFEEQSLRMDLVSYNSATGIPDDSWDVK